MGYISILMVVERIQTLFLVTMTSIHGQVIRNCAKRLEESLTFDTHILTDLYAKGLLSFPQREIIEVGLHSLSFGTFASYTK